MRKTETWGVLSDLPKITQAVSIRGIILSQCPTKNQVEPPKFSNPPFPEAMGAEIWFHFWNYGWKCPCSLGKSMYPIINELLGFGGLFIYIIFLSCIRGPTQLLNWANTSAKFGHWPSARNTQGRNEISEGHERVVRKRTWGGDHGPSPSLEKYLQ